MDHSITTRNLKPIELTEMYLAFLDSFSDYSVPFQLSKEQFVRKFVEKLKIDFSLSIGAYHNDALAGFIFTSVNYYEGKLTAYNGGTGVRPNHRGKRIAHQMFNYLIPLLEKRKVKQCVLEVLWQNERAIKTYEAIGFTKTKHFKCFKLDESKSQGKYPDIDLEIYKVERPNWYNYEQFTDGQTSFLDSPQMINENLANETILEVHTDHGCIGFAVFQPTFGRISQIGVHPEYRRRGVGSCIIQYILNLSHIKTLTIININNEASETVNFFRRLGFNNQLDQYEMILSLE